MQQKEKFLIAFQGKFQKSFCQESQEELHFVLTHSNRAAHPGLRNQEQFSSAVGAQLLSICHCSTDILRNRALCYIWTGL